MGIWLCHLGYVTLHIVKDVVKLFSSRDPSIHPSVLSSKCVATVKTHSSIFSLFFRVQDSTWIGGHGGSKGGGDGALVCMARKKSVRMVMWFAF
jgi:hypothetical protein